MLRSFSSSSSSSSGSRLAVVRLSARAPCRAWTRALAAQPQRMPAGEYEARRHSTAFKVGGLVGRGVASIRRQAQESGALDAASKLKDGGFRAAGVDKATGDTALKAAGGLWLLARTVHKVRKVALGAVIAGAAYGVARAHSPQTADRYGKRITSPTPLILTKLNGPVWKQCFGFGQDRTGERWCAGLLVLERSSHRDGRREHGACACACARVCPSLSDSLSVSLCMQVGQTADDGVQATSTGSGWGGLGSLEHFLTTEVRGLTGGAADYPHTMRSEGYDSIAMLIGLAKDDQTGQGQAASARATDWGRMVAACGIKPGDAVKIKQALLQKHREPE